MSLHSDLGLMRATDFSKRHPWDRWFWTAVLALALIEVVLGFQAPVRARMAGESPPASLALIAHAWSFSGWLFLLGGQVVLVARRSVRWHRLVGRAMLPMAAVMVWSGAVAQIEGDRLRMEARPELLSFTIVPLSHLAMFAVLVSAAWIARRDPASHKRWILLATGAVMSGAFFRAFGPLLYPVLPNSHLTDFLVNNGGTLLFVLIGVVHDLATRRAVHPVYLFATPAMLVVMVAVLAATRTEWLPEVTRALISP